MKELKIGCGKPTGAKVGQQSESKSVTENKENRKEQKIMSVRVGQKAPDFMQKKHRPLQIASFFNNV